MSDLVGAIRDQDEREVEEAVLALSRSRRFLAPLGLIVGAFVMVLDGLKLLVGNWRLTLVQVLPAMWIWAAVLDLKVYAFKGKTFRIPEGPVLIPLGLAIVAGTAASFYLNASFALAISQPSEPRLGMAFRQAKNHLGTILAWGGSIGGLLAFSVLAVPIWGRWWFALALSIVVGVMMLTYVAVPARLAGLEGPRSRRDSVSVTVVVGVAGAVVCTPAYVLGRVGILMLGAKYLLVPGVLFLLIGLVLQAGATGAVKAIKMSAKLSVSPPTVAPVMDRPAESHR